MNLPFPVPVRPHHNITPASGGRQPSGTLPEDMDFVSGMALAADIRSYQSMAPEVAYTAGCRTETPRRTACLSAMQIRKLRIVRYAPLLPGVRRKRNNHTVAAGKRGVHVMASTFTWLDYSESDRQKMQDVLDQLGERTTRDELGIGGIRDAFADLLFPGTTTIQTAAKYFLFVPWMYVQLEQKYVPSKDVLAIARKFEAELSKTLSADDEDVDGIIGRRAGENLKRTASSVYWQGLLKWGIRTFPGSQDAYHRSLDKLYLRRKGRAESKAEFDGEGSDGAGVHNWHPDLIDPDNSFPKTASLKLAKHEAIYLRERVLSNCDGSLLAYLLKHPGHVEGVDFAWHLEMSLNPQSLLAEQLKHGQNFSEVMHGAQLLYNLILAEQSLNADKTAEYRERLMEWWTVVEKRRSDFNDWNRIEFWRIVDRSMHRVSGAARTFVTKWIDMAMSASSAEDVIDSEQMRQLVIDREFQIKRSLARTSNQHARELWSGAAGSEQMDLRWRTSRRIITDILRGLQENVDA